MCYTKVIFIFLWHQHLVSTNRSTLFYNQRVISVMQKWNSCKYFSFNEYENFIISSSQQFYWRELNGWQFDNNNLKFVQNGSKSERLWWKEKFVMKTITFAEAMWMYSKKQKPSFIDLCWWFLMHYKNKYLQQLNYLSKIVWWEEK